MSKMKMVSVPEYAIKELDALIKVIYWDALMFKKFPDDFYYEDGGIGSANFNSQKAKEVAKSFGLYPYNQYEVRCP